MLYRTITIIDDVGGYTPTRFDGIYVRYFLSCFVAFAIQQFLIRLLGKNEVNRLTLSYQRTKTVTFSFRLEHIACAGSTVVVGFRSDDHIAVTGRTVRIDHMQTRCSFLPTTAVLLDLTNTAVTKINTEGIDNVDILISRILDVHRTIETTDDFIAPIVRCLLPHHAVTGTDRGSYSTVANESEVLRHTEVRRQVQVIRVIDDLLAVRVEIDGITTCHHHRHELLTDQLRPHLLNLLFVLMICKLNGVAPYL